VITGAATPRANMCADIDLRRDVHGAFATAFAMVARVLSGSSDRKAL
jgi:hypothetical protein